jgi:hypothetical protein
MRTGVLTIHDLIHTPIGKGAAAMDPKPLVSDLRMRYMKLERKIRVQSLMTDKDGKRIIIHFLVPSENVDKVDYDVVLSFVPDPKFPRAMTRWPMQIYSNSPAFTFTYAYVANKQGWLVPELQDYVGKVALRESPDTRNPIEILGLEKTIVFATFYMRENRLDDSSVINRSGSGAQNINIKMLLNMIKPNDIKLKERKQQEDVERSRKQSQRKAAQTKAAGSQGVAQKSKSSFKSLVTRPLVADSNRMARSNFKSPVKKKQK